MDMERKTTAGIPAAVPTTATGLICPWPFKKQGHGADTHPWPLRLSIDAAGGTSTDQTKTTDGYITRRFIVHPYQSNSAAAVAELPTANQWIDRVRRRKRLSCGHQAHLQQALTRDGEKPKIVSWCCHSVPSLWLCLQAPGSVPRPGREIKYAKRRKFRSGGWGWGRATNS
jgi:hypothetical protein